MKCLTCGRPTMAHSENWYNEFSIDCAGDCSGCIAIAEELAVNARCAFHGKDCIVWKHYEHSVHLCNPNVCIEQQDISTLMINDSMRRWNAGEENPFFDRISTIDLTDTEDLSGLSDADFIKRLVG